MHKNYYWCLALWLMLLLVPARLSAYTTTIAFSGDEAFGTGGGAYQSFEAPALNNLGTLLISAQLEQDGSIITGENDAGIWRYRGGGGQIDLPVRIAQTGVEGVSGVSETSFESLGQTALNDRNEVFYGAQLITGAGGVNSDNARGIWFHSSALNRLPLVRTGSGNVGDIFGANFVGFPGATGEAQFDIAEDGSVAFAGILEPGVGQVTTASDRGVWRYDPLGGDLIAREEIDFAPGAFASFNAFGRVETNAHEQLTFFASLKIGGAVNTMNSRGIWRFEGDTGELLAQSRSGGVPGLEDRDFEEFSKPWINDAGNVVFFSQLDNGTKGIWKYTANDVSVLSLTQSGNVPEVPEASFANMDLVAWNDGDQALIDAALVEGAGGVDTGNRLGLWLVGTDQRMVARAGDGNVAGVSTASFAGFGKATLNHRGHVAFAAELLHGEGGIDASNDTGLWLSGPAGENWLVAREGDALEGKTIVSLDFLGEESYGTTGINDLGELAFVANFADGDSGVFLFRPYAADFNRTGAVDEQDLSAWETAYGRYETADADHDGDSDGADFLVWQREVGSGSSVAPISRAIPEPSSMLLIVFSIGTSWVALRLPSRSV